MSRALSTTALQDLFAQEMDDCLLFLITIDHPSWASPLRIVNNNEDVTSNGDVYSAFPVEITLPDEAQDLTQTSAKLRVCNVDRQIISLFRSLTSAPSVTVSVVLGSTPDTIEAGPAEYTLENYTYDKFIVEGTLSYEDILNEPFPAGTFNPADYDGLF